MQSLVHQLGGTLLTSIPPAPGAAACTSSQGTAQQPQPRVDYVIADAERHTTKYLFAAATGVPVCTAAWLESISRSGVAAVAPLLPPPPPAAACSAAAADGSPVLVLRPADDTLAQCPGARALSGLRVMLHGGTYWRRAFEPLVLHAGGIVLQQLQAPAQGDVLESAVDLVVVNSNVAHVAWTASATAGAAITSAAAGGVKGSAAAAGPLGAAAAASGGAARRGGSSGLGSSSNDDKETEALRRSARRLRVPVVDVDVVVHAILSGGRWPEHLQASFAARRGAQAVLPQQQMRNSSSSAAAAGGDAGGGGAAAGGGGGAAAGASSRAGRGRPSSGGEAGIGGSSGGRRRQAAPDLLVSELDHEGTAEGLPQQQQQQVQAPQQQIQVQQQQQVQVQQQQVQVQQQQQQQQQPPLDEIAVAAQRGTVEICWLQQDNDARAITATVGALCPQRVPAASRALSPQCATVGRTHFQAFRLSRPAAAEPGVPAVDRTVRVGDCILLAPAPGEDAPRVLLLSALWQELPSDGVPRQLCRGRRFYHASETPFPFPAGHLLLSAHWEERVALAGVLDAVDVQWTLPGGLPPPAGQLPTRFMCSFFYDHVAMTLRPLVPEDVAL